MVIKKIVAGICIIMSSSLLGMQPQQPAPAVNMVTLVSAEGAEFQVPLDAAQEAGTISGLLLAGGQEAAHKRLEFRTISSAIMMHIVNLLKASAANRNAPTKQALLDQLQSIPTQDFNAVIEAAHFLDIPFLKDMIMLVSADDKKFYVPIDVAQESGTLRDLLSVHGFAGQEATSKYFEFKTIPTPVMTELVQILEKLALNKNTKNRRSLLENFKSIPIKNAKEILEEADFLDIPLIKDIIAYRFAQLLTKQKISPETFQQQLEDTELRPDLLQSLLQKVAVFYYVSNPNNPTLQGSAYGLSIQDYLDFNPELIEARRSLGTVLSLSFLHLISLEGLHNIPNIASVTMLYLDHNQLEQIQQYTFDGLQNLNVLMLNYNKLRQIHQQAFAGLMNLQNLYLNDNQLQQIQQNTFAGLHNVYDLHLENNQLQQIQLDSFAGLHNLHSLNLENNQLQQIQPQAFAKLQNLRSLDLRKNKLSDIRPTLFENLPYLHNLYLSRNPITREKKDALRVAMPDVNI